MTRQEKGSVDVDAGTVTVERFFATTPARLYKAWTDPKLTSQWLAPGPMDCELPLYEAREGGRFRIVMRGTGPDGEPFEMAFDGTFDALEPDRRVVMTWNEESASGGPGSGSVVTVTLTPAEGGTLLRLTQDKLPDPEGALGAGHGWLSAFDKMVAVL